MTTETPPQSGGPDRLAELEAERSFLLQSLRDLDEERAAGDVDDRLLPLPMHPPTLSPVEAPHIGNKAEMYSADGPNDGSAAASPSRGTRPILSEPRRAARPTATPVTPRPRLVGRST